MKILLVHRPLNWRKPDTIIPYLIRKATKTHWNHAAFLIELNSYFFVVEAAFSGVRIIPYSAWAKDQEIAIYKVPDTDYLKSKVLSKCGKVGYSLKDLLWFMPIYLITGKFYGQKVNNFTNKPTCYEFVAWCLGLTSWFRMTPNEFKAFIDRAYTKEGIYQAKEYKL